MDVRPSASRYTRIFEQCIDDYHRTDRVDAGIENPYPPGGLDHLLYRKNWIDTVQWHLEDIIRRPDISAAELVEVKRKIDRLNQQRTDLVEQIDDYFAGLLKSDPPKPGARMNSETPAWILDRLSILLLKIYHMREQSLRSDAGAGHRAACAQKLQVLEEQRTDLERCYDELIDDIRSGYRYFKVYRQMKMYNDPSLNPELYGKDAGKGPK
jgi:hypothetical protein